MLDNLKKYKIILASNSPRRRELLSGLGVDYEVKIVPGIDETYPESLNGEEIPVYIAQEKANAYRASLQPDELVITADTIVYVDGMVLGKPVDEAMKEVGAVVEGYYAAKSAWELGQRMGVEMPITGAAYAVLYRGVSAKSVVETLLRRSPKAESEDTGWM